MDIRIHDALSRRPYCSLVEKDGYQIARRLKQIEKDYFVLRNNLNGSFEVHSTKNMGDTYCFTVPYEQLDSRTIEYCMRTRVSTNILATIEENNRKLDESRARARQNDIDARTRYVADKMQYAMNQDRLHEGYKSVFVV